jgi:acetylglutamate kinase
VDTTVITSLFAHATPVISPLALDESGRLLNCNADTVAGCVAGALGAAALVLLSDVDQLRADPLDPASALESVDGARARQLLAEGAAREGMRPKMIAALDALDGGAARVLVANGTRPHALRDALAGTIPLTEVRA